MERLKTMPKVQKSHQFFTKVVEYALEYIAAGDLVFDYLITVDLM